MSSSCSMPPTSAKKTSSFLRETSYNEKREERREIIYEIFPRVPFFCLSVSFFFFLSFACQLLCFVGKCFKL